MLSEFKEFLEKFNVIPIAVGLVLALAFAPMVGAVVALVLSIVARIIGIDPTVQEDGSEVYEFAAVEVAGINIGDTINATITFIMIAFVVFLIVKALAKGGAQTTLNATPDQELLGEIRDILKARG